MKIFFLIAALACISSAASSQAKGNIKLYGYKQDVSGGKGPEMTEGSDTRAGNSSRKNYFLYAVSSSRIYPSEIWVEGVQYGVTVKTITETPVEYSDEANIGSPKMVLVPTTDQKVVQLILNPNLGAKSSGPKAKSLSRINELVVVYKQNGKFYYSTLKTLSSLESAAMQ